MNTPELKWRDYPNLVANGLFKIIVNGHEVNFHGYYPDKKFIIRIHEYKSIVDGRDCMLKELIPIKDCTLISRSIDSLTEEEKEKLSLTVYDVNVFKEYDEKIGLGLVYFKENINAFLYLLSIGIWPGSEEGVERRD